VGEHCPWVIEQAKRTRLLGLNVSGEFRVVKNLDKKILDVKLSNMNTNESLDVIDHLLQAWHAARPDLDASPLALVGRVIVLAQRLEHSVSIALSKHGLTLGQFDILATLRRHGPRGGLTPSELLQSVVLSSGGMTARLDKLEEAGWITRVADAQDRRKVVIELTPKGRRVIDAATATRFAEARASLPPLTEDEQEILADLLRRWLLGLSKRSSGSLENAAKLSIV
jgi:DNA-binding MarR family transcriptional regulator